MDEQELLLEEMWNNWKPYNRAEDDRWRSYVVSSNEATLLETEADCITLCKSASGTIYLQ